VQCNVRHGDEKLHRDDICFVKAVPYQGRTAGARRIERLEVVVEAEPSNVRTLCPKMGRFSLSSANKNAITAYQSVKSGYHLMRTISSGVDLPATMAIGN
jgi:hypothetical protein